MSKSRPSPPTTVWVVVIVMCVLVGAVVAANGVLTRQAAGAPTPSPRLQTSTSSDPAPTGPTTSVGPVAGAVIHWRPELRTGSLKVLDKHWFTIGYHERRKNPAWVTYELAGPISHPGPEPTRPATFATDFDTTAHVSHRDYTGSHYDRGHLAPAYAMWSRGGAEAFLATFVCSNTIPQPHAVNAGIWEDLETRIAGRSSPHGGMPSSGGWAERYGAVTVVNGPIYGARVETLRSGVGIPEVDFSVVIRNGPGGYQALAWEIPNVGDPAGPLDRYLTTIKQIEDDAGLDFFAGDTQALRGQLEMARATTLWP